MDAKSKGQGHKVTFDENAGQHFLCYLSIDLSQIWQVGSAWQGGDLISISGT